jgi:chromosome segregation protein
MATAAATPTIGVPLLTERDGRTNVDKGAHFHRCDFQVHTPRDPNWDGFRPVTDDERLDFGRSLIAACRSKGLDAIAITDHHDFAFFRFVQEAAAAEADAAGEPMPAERRIVVFPGIELTLAAPFRHFFSSTLRFPSTV